MQYLIVDLEATCWDTGTSPSRMEIIEIGAVVLSAEKAPPGLEFAQFVRPIVEPTLSTFCTQLTSIQQQDIDQANDFSAVFPVFLGWIGSEPFKLCSWGGRMISSSLELTASDITWRFRLHLSSISI